MAILETGLQGSGKSYREIYRIYEDHDKYSKIYCDVDGFRGYKNAEYKKFSDLRKIIDEAYHENVKLDKSFDASIQILKNFGLLSEDASKNARTLIIIDEAQNHFGTSVPMSPQLQWLITQHRHLFIELVLITQKETLIRSGYMLFNEVYVAVPPIKKISSKYFAYDQYATAPPKKDNFIQRVKVPIKQEVFDLYKSGDKVVSPNPWKRFGWLMIIPIFLVVFSVKFFMSNYGQAVEKQESNLEVTNQNYIAKSTRERIAGDQLLVTIVATKEGFYIREYSGAFDILPNRILTYIMEEYEGKLLFQDSRQFLQIKYIRINKKALIFLGYIKEKNNK